MDACEENATNQTELEKAEYPSADQLFYLVHNGSMAAYTRSPLRPPTKEFHQYQDIYDPLTFAMENVVMPIVFIIGIVGNLMNLLVLVQKRLHKGLNNIERSTLVGLVCLAISDLLFCVVGLPGTLLVKTDISMIRGTYGGLYYRVMRLGLINTFLFTSTWMIVAISLERYLALCHPFTARWLIRTKRSAFIHVSVALLSALLNLPLFLKQHVLTAPCSVKEECLTCHFVAPTNFFLEHAGFFHVHYILWTIVGTAFPFLILLASNLRIIYAVWKTSRMTPPLNSLEEQKQEEVTSRITLTLVAMVMTFLVLVGPSMILTLLYALSALPADIKSNFGYRIAVIFTNFGQAVKFATNFLLYCVTNRHFRETVASFFSRGNVEQTAMPRLLTSRRRRPIYV